MVVSLRRSLVSEGARHPRSEWGDHGPQGLADRLRMRISREPRGQAEESGLLSSRPAELTEQFSGLLWRDLMFSLLWALPSDRTPATSRHRSRDAAAALPQCKAFVVGQSLTALHSVLLQSKPSARHRTTDVSLNRRMRSCARTSTT